MGERVGERAGGYASARNVSAASLKSRDPGALKWFRFGISKKRPSGAADASAREPSMMASSNPWRTGSGASAHPMDRGRSCPTTACPRERDQRLQVVAGYPLRQRDVVLRRGVCDRGAVGDVRPHLVQVEAGQGDAVRHSAEHRPADAVGQLAQPLPSPRGLRASSRRRTRRPRGMCPSRSRHRSPASGCGTPPDRAASRCAHAPADRARAPGSRRGRARAPSRSGPSCRGRSTRIRARSRRPEHPDRPRCTSPGVCRRRRTRAAGRACWSGRRGGWPPFHLGPVPRSRCGSHGPAPRPRLQPRDPAVTPRPPPADVGRRGSRREDGVSADGADQTRSRRAAPSSASTFVQYWKNRSRMSSMVMERP